MGLRTKEREESVIHQQLSGGRRPRMAEATNFRMASS